MGGDFVGGFGREEGFERDDFGGIGEFEEEPGEAFVEGGGEAVASGDVSSFSSQEGGRGEVERKNTHTSLLTKTTSALLITAPTSGWSQKSASTAAIFPPFSPQSRKRFSASTTCRRAR